MFLHCRWSQVVLVLHESSGLSLCNNCREYKRLWGKEFIVTLDKARLSVFNTVRQNELINRRSVGIWQCQLSLATAAMISHICQTMMRKTEWLSSRQLLWFFLLVLVSEWDLNAFPTLGKAAERVCATKNPNHLWLKWMVLVLTCASGYGYVHHMQVDKHRHTWTHLCIL